MSHGTDNGAGSAALGGHPGEVIPDTVSRHATVHKPTVAHLTADNALMAIMLATSILTDQQAWCEEVRMSDATGQE
jgi:hypothetical protein